jgi:hypothetical protein
MAERPEPVAAAHAFLARHFPDAGTAFLGGSVLTPDRTPMSDLDIVVVLGDGDPRAPYRQTLDQDGWVVEAFVHDRASLDRFWDRDTARRSAALLNMCSGRVLEDRDGRADEIQQAARRRLEDGPPTLDGAELDAARYGLTDLLEDLAGCDRDDELAHIAGLVLREVAELALGAAGRWAGTGKALARSLAAAEPALAERLVHAHRLAVLDGDTAALHRVATDVLRRVGGPLLVGYRVAAPRSGGRHAAEGAAG